MTVVSFTLIELLVAILIIALLVSVGTTLWLRARNLVASGGTGAAPLTAGPKRFVWVSETPTFPVNTEGTFKFRLERLNVISGAWNPAGNEDTLVGAVTPATVRIVSVNGAAPGNPTSFPASVGVSGTAFEAETDGDGHVTFVLKGPVPADGTFYVVFIDGPTDVTSDTKQFAVVPPP